MTELCRAIVDHSATASVVGARVGVLEGTVVRAIRRSHKRIGRMAVISVQIRDGLLGTAYQGLDGH